MNWDLIGHEWAVEMLRTHLQRGEQRHAYLFTGPQALGRRSLALRLAQALNCAQPPAPGERCGACRACLGLERMQHPDLTVLRTPEDKTLIPIEQVREMQRGLSLHAYEAPYRVALILRMEEASQAAQNALLKTLEEPPDQVLLLLTAENTEMILPTILSRCELLRLRPVPAADLAAGLQSRFGLDGEQARLLAHISGGRPGAAISLLQDPPRLEARASLLAEHLQLLTASRAERFAFAEAMTKNKDNWRDEVRQTLLAWQSLWRDILLRAAGAAITPANLDLAPEIARIAQHVGPFNAHNAITAIQQAQDRLKANANARLVLEVMLLDLPRISPAVIEHG